jgi:hypothetical protein
MHVLRLLTTTKSLVGLNQTESHYRVTRERLVPQFGPTKNPFRTTNTSAPAREEINSVPSSTPAKFTQTPAPAAASASRLVDPKPSEGLNAPSPKKRVRSWSAGLWSEWTKKLAPVLSRPPHKPSTAPRPSATKPPVQGELSLDRIKVVRNDLSDADLEIVPLKSSTPRVGATPVLPAAEKAAEAGMTRSRFSGLFSAGRR